LLAYIALQVEHRVEPVDQIAICFDLVLIHNHQLESFSGGEQPAAEAGIRQDEIVLQGQGAIGSLKQGQGVCTVVGVAIDEPVKFGIGQMEIPGPLLGGGAGRTAADGLGCTRFPGSVTAQIEQVERSPHQQ